MLVEERKEGNDLLLEEAMLARANRLTGAKSFERVKKEGKLFQGQSFAIVVLAREDQGPSRFGFVVSTKISKKATVRNKIKRTLREVVKKDLSKFEKSFDIVFLVKRLAQVTPTEKIRTEVPAIFKKAGLIK